VTNVGHEIRAERTLNDYSRAIDDQGTLVGIQTRDYNFGSLPTLSNSPVVSYRIAETTNSETSQLMTQRKGNDTVYIPPRKDSIAVERK